MSATDLLYLDKADVQFGTYTLIINGRPVLYNRDKVVHAEITTDFQINFFYLVMADNKARARSDDNGKLRIYVESLMSDKVLYGEDLSGWFSPKNLDMTLRGRVNTLPELKLMVYETQEYMALREISMSEDKNRSFRHHATGETLGRPVMVKLLNSLRASAFQSMIEMYRLRITRFAASPRGIRGYSYVYSLCFLKIDGIYNPLWDDPEIKNIFFETRLGRAIMKYKIEGTRGSQYTYLTHHQLSEVLDVGGENNPRILHFSFHMLIPLIAAHFLDDLDPRFYPVSGETVWIKTGNSELGPDYPVIVTDAVYRSFPESVRSNPDNYINRTSIITYWLNHLNEFRYSGLKDSMLRMEEFMDVVSSIKVG